MSTARCWEAASGPRCLVALAAIFALLALGSFPATSRAGEGSISIDGTATVVRGLHGTFHITGNAPGPNQDGWAGSEVEVATVPAGEPCENSGLQPSVDSKLSFDAPVEGPAPFAFTWEPPFENFVATGPYTLCASIIRHFGEDMANARMAIAVVKPEFHMKESVPHRVRVGQRATFSVHGLLQAPAYLETEILPSKILVCPTDTCHYKKVRRCASTPVAEEKLVEESESVIEPFYGEGTPQRRLGPGPFHFSRRLRAESAGLYRMCSWLTEQGENKDPARLFVSATWHVAK